MNNNPSEQSPPSAPREPENAGSWLSQNAMPIIFVLAAIGFVIWKDVNVLNLAIVLVGLGLVIFLHELGHFLAAKFCDVHVETFSIGFGKAIPGCQFKYGETTYKLGYIPLGGYVKMVGEGDNADTDEAEEDPRSFKNKSVYQRMLIISAGVIMNVILGVACFVVAYLHGIDEPPGIIGSVNAGSPAWQAGIQANTQFLQIGGIEKPTFDDIRTKIMSSSSGQGIKIHLVDPEGHDESITISPKRENNSLFPTLGILHTQQLTLIKAQRKDPNQSIAREGSSAANAKDANGAPLFLPGDKFIAMTDPNNPAVIKELPKDARDHSNQKYDYFEFRRRMQLLRDKPVVIRVERGNERVDITVAPEYTQKIPGLRLQIGKISGLRNNSPATSARPIDGTTDVGLVAINPDIAGSGDRLIAVEVSHPDGKKTRYVEIPDSKAAENVVEAILDPARLPFDLSEWYEKWVRHNGGSTDKIPSVRVTVMRSPTDASQRTPRRCIYDLDWDPKYRFSNEFSDFYSPISLPCLGIAYQIETIIDEVAKGSDAENVGLQKSDVIIGFRHKEFDKNKKLVDSKWIEFEQHQGAIICSYLNMLEHPEIEVKVRRAVDNENRFQELELKLSTVRDNTWPQIDRGFYFEKDFRTQKAEDLMEAIQFGGQRTLRKIREIYQQLYSLVSGRISIKMMSGPLSIANISYKIVDYDTWSFIAFIGMISLNLAIVNFLPIPVLDGGHMVFLIYEKIRGKPAPEKIMEWSLYAGLGMILSLMVFVIYLDIKRLFFN